MKTLEQLAIALCVVLVMTPAWAGNLHEVVRDGDTSGAERLIAAGADVEAQDEAALTPLVTAALAGQRETMILLIDKGADPRGRDGNGFTALHAAAHTGHLDIVEMLIDHGLDINDQENMAGITPLHAAAERGYRDIVDILLRHGANVHVKSGTGHTPVVMAVLNAHAGTVKLLRDHGADCTKIKLARYHDFCVNAGT
jgi:ankyrin repeat protein